MMRNFRERHSNAETTLKQHLVLYVLGVESTEKGIINESEMDCSSAFHVTNRGQGQNESCSVRVV